MAYYSKRGKAAFSLLVTVVLAVLSFSFCVKAEELLPAHNKKILIIHSYHLGLAWTQGQDEGVREILSGYDHIEISEEFLDTKRFDLEDISRSFADFLAIKYAKKKFHIVLVTDNNALTFVSENYDRLFADTPVVFSGINDFKPEMLSNFNGRATGVVQVLEPKRTLDLIFKLQPELDRLVVVSGITPTAQAIRNEVEKKLAEYAKTNPIVWWNKLETDDLLGRLAKLSDNDAVLLCNFNRDRLGNYYSHVESGRMISKASNAPVYAMEDHYLDTGVVGGYMNSSKDQGIAAGMICVEILDKGKIPEVIMTSPNVVMFDYFAMARFGLDESRLPESAVIINRPVSYYRQNKRLIWNVTAVFCLLFSALLAVSYGLLRSQKIERLLKESEGKFRALFNNTFEFIGILARDGTVLEVNQTALDFAGIKECDVIGKRFWETGWWEQSNEQHEWLSNVIAVAAGGEFVRREAKHIAADGSIHYIDLSITPVKDYSGNVIFLIPEGRDITERKQVQDALSESEKKYRTLFEQSADAILIIENDKFIDCNQATVGMLGYANKAELLNTHPSELSPEYQPDGQESFAKAEEMMAMAVERGSHRFEWDHKRRNGEVFPVEVLLTSVTLEERSFIHVVWRDITERKKAEEEAINYRKFMDSVPGFGFAKDINLRYVSANQSFCDLLDISYDRILGKSDYDIFPSDLAKKYIDDDKRVIETGKPILLEEITINVKTGQRFVVATRKHPWFDKDGNTIGVYGIGFDITEIKQAQEALKQSEMELRAISDYTYDWESWFAPDGKLNWVNPAVEKLTGYSTDDCSEMPDYPFAIVHEEDREELKKLLQEAISEQTSINNKEFRILHKEGYLRWMVASWQPIYDNNGKNIGLRMSVRDFTEKKKTQQQREELLQILKYKNKELQDIVYTASHDLRSPLVNIEGFSGELNAECEQLIALLEEQTEGYTKNLQVEVILKETIPECLMFITTGAKRMSSLLDGLLQISRIGTVEIETKNLDIKKIIKQIVESMEHQKKKSNISVTVEDLPDCIGDEHMVDHVFTNLISNAIKYRDPAKDGIVRISGKHEDGMSVYCVEDNGLGIAPYHQKKVFEIFHRLNPQGAVKGEGLGLTIVTRILDRLDGRIWLESEPGVGSRFYVSFPAG